MEIAVGDILRVVAVLSYLDGDIIQNVFNAIIGSGGGPYDDGDIVDDAGAWLTDMYSELVGTMTDNCDGSEVRVYIYDTVNEDWDEVGIDSWTFNPTATQDNLAKGVAGLINCKTTDPDVSGKKYLGGLSEGCTADGVLTPTFIAEMALFGTAWVQDFTGGTSGAAWEPGIWSPTRKELLPMGNVIIIPNEPAYQRRRKSGVGI